MASTKKIRHELDKDAFDTHVGDMTEGAAVGKMPVWKHPTEQPQRQCVPET